MGVITTIALYLLPELLRLSQRRHPGITFPMTEEPTGSEVRVGPGPTLRGIIYQR